jgi:hypothetical protein
VQDFVAIRRPRGQRLRSLIGRSPAPAMKFRRRGAARISTTSRSHSARPAGDANASSPSRRVSGTTTANAVGGGAAQPIAPNDPTGASGQTDGGRSVPRPARLLRPPADAHRARAARCCHVGRSTGRTAVQPITLRRPPRSRGSRVSRHANTRDARTGGISACRGAAPAPSPPPGGVPAADRRRWLPLTAGAPSAGPAPRLVH